MLPTVWERTQTSHATVLKTEVQCSNMGPANRTVTRNRDNMADTQETEDKTAGMEGTSGNGVSTPTSYAFVAQPFVIGTEKSRMLKPLEEAAEVFGAWQEMDRVPSRMRRSDVILECCDTIQAVANALASLGVTQAEVNKAFAQVHERNEDRGRYGDNPQG